MNTLALSTPSTNPAAPGWDLTLDENGDIALLTGAQAIAQDIGSAVRTFQGECWYDTTQGVPYYAQVYGKALSLQFLKQLIVSAASIVPQVDSIACFLTGPGVNREVGGQIQATVGGQLVAVVQTSNILGVAPWWASAVDPDAAEASGFLTSDGGVVLTDDQGNPLATG